MSSIGDKTPFPYFQFSSGFNSSAILTTQLGASAIALRSAHRAGVFPWSGVVRPGLRQIEAYGWRWGAMLTFYTLVPASMNGLIDRFAPLDKEQEGFAAKRQIGYDFVDGVSTAGLTAIWLRWFNDCRAVHRIQYPAGPIRAGWPTLLSFGFFVALNGAASVLSLRSAAAPDADREPRGYGSLPVGAEVFKGWMY